MMNGRLKLIEQQLTGIDGAAFQNLCDIYLFCGRGNGHHEPHRQPVGNHPLNILFSHLNEAQQAKAKPFILDYITENRAHRRKMNAVFYVVRKFFRDFIETAFIDPDWV